MKKKENDYYRKEIKWLAHYVQLHRISLIFIVVIGVSLSFFGVAFAFLSKLLIDVATGATEGSLIYYGIALAVVMVIEILVQSVSSVLSTKVTKDMTNSMRAGVLDRLLESQWLFYSRIHSGEILTRMTSDVSVVVSGVTTMVPGIIALSTRLIGAFVLLYYFDPILAVFAILIGPVFILLNKLFSPIIRNLHAKAQDAESTVRKTLQEIITNILTVKVFDLEDNVSVKIDEYQKIHRTWTIKKSVYGTGATAMLSLGFGGGYLLALLWGAYRLAQGVITFGTLAAFLQLINQVQGPFMGLAHYLPKWSSTMASVERLMYLEGLPKERIAGKASIVNKQDPWGLAVENMGYAYYNDGWIFKDFNLKIEPGEILGIMGPSGKGKTTLLRLFLALIYPDEGRLFLFNKHGETKSVSPETRPYFAYVSQGNTLFSGTIIENLKVGRENVTHEEVKNALFMACALDFINQLSLKEETLIGESGEGLSEGQLQRISIARALLRDAPILLLDEATSFLDESCEKEILSRIRAGLHGKTCVIVSHRPSIRQYCDRIYNMP